MYHKVDLRDISFERNAKDWIHKIMYTVPNAHDLESNVKNVELSYFDNDLTITITCDCCDPFSIDCMDFNLPLLCKTIMTALDGTYPLPLAMAPSAASLLVLKSKTATFSNKVCDNCCLSLRACICVSREPFFKRLRRFFVLCCVKCQ